MKRNHRARQMMTAVLALLFCMVLGLFGYTMIARARGNPLPTVFGWGRAVVLSGSMEPALPVGALLFIHAQATYEPGEIITYKDEFGNLVTHRLVALENDVATTRGDANNTDDAPFPAARILGKVEAVLPGVGSAILWLQTPLGFCIILLLCALLIMLPWVFHGKEGKPHDGT